MSLFLNLLSQFKNNSTEDLLIYSSHLPNEFKSSLFLIRFFFKSSDSIFVSLDRTFFENKKHNNINFINNILFIMLIFNNKEYYQPQLKVLTIYQALQIQH